MTQALTPPSPTAQILPFPSSSSVSTDEIWHLLEMKLSQTLSGEEAAIVKEILVLLHTKEARLTEQTSCQGRIILLLQQQIALITSQWHKEGSPTLVST